MATAEEIDYPLWVCHDCALASNPQVRRSISCWHDDICDVCNRWLQVTQPRDYGNPKLTCKRDKGKIRLELCKAYLQMERDHAPDAYLEAMADRMVAMDEAAH